MVKFSIFIACLDFHEIVQNFRLTQIIIRVISRYTMLEMVSDCRMQYIIPKGSHL